jgi:hypothetical protein
MADSERMVKLSGERGELNEWEWWSSRSNFSLFSVVKIDDNYFLKSPRFKQKNREEVREELERMRPVIMAFAKMQKLRTLFIGFEGVYNEAGEPVIPLDEDGRPIITLTSGPAATIYPRYWKENGIFHMGRYQADMEVDMEYIEHEIGPEPPKMMTDLIPGWADTVLELDVMIQKGQQLDSALNLLEKCLDDPEVRQTFSYFADTANWFNFYNTYEMIKFDVDGSLKEYGFDSKKCKIIRDSWAEPDELEGFKRAANDPHSDGNPRHSLAYYNDKKKRKKEKKKKPASFDVFNEQRREKNREKKPLMRLYEADALMTRIFRNWCKWKGSQCEVKRLLLSAALSARAIYYASSSYNHSGK